MLEKSWIQILWQYFMLEILYHPVVRSVAVVWSIVECVGQTLTSVLRISMTAVVLA